MSDGAKLSSVKWLFGLSPLLLACAALALAGCGGGEESTTSAATGERTATTEAGRAETATPEGRQGDGGQPGGKQGGGGQSERPARQDTGPGSSEPGTKAVAPGVPVQPAGDNSVQEFGREGQVDEREQALATLKTFLKARAAGEWERTCAATSRQFKRQIAVATAGLPKKERPKGCPATLRFVFKLIPRAELRASAEVRELLSFRVSGRYAYIIFRGAEGRADYIAMRNDGGVWKINTANPEPFPTAAG
jgi:hypothetical protein